MLNEVFSTGGGLYSMTCTSILNANNILPPCRDKFLWSANTYPNFKYGHHASRKLSLSYVLTINNKRDISWQNNWCLVQWFNNRDKSLIPSLQDAVIKLWDNLIEVRMSSRDIGTEPTVQWGTMSLFYNYGNRHLQQNVTLKIWLTA